MTGNLTGHNGKVANLRAPLKVTGCPPAVTLKRNRLRVKPGRDGATFRTVVDRAKETWRLTVRVRR